MYNRLIRRLEQAGVLSGVEIKALQDVNLRERFVVARSDVYDNDFADNVHLILGGFACRYKIWAGGNRRIISLIVPGDLCDGHVPMPFVLQNRVAALTTCKVADIPRQTMVELINTYPGIARALWWVTLVKLSTMQAWLANMGREADKRIAHFFCEMLVRLRAVGLADESSYEFNLTQSDLGEIFGLSNVHVNRVLKSLRDADLLIVANRRVTIPDVERLERFAEFDPGYLSGTLSFGEGIRHEA
ncbi:Crp/Fnr family transcriptional regulator [Methylobacterium nodulans]|uniref:Putative transcriptional regulator, Crp/Fnr family n=1 Tax=Methylobacterium nodulans (strain LMG 21967 / CNCM I-2342 / ORS 2060) TaxID=460265 RepID=B8IXT6_METNO|nr:Crp/Fnr family transcriptional regulator [Methylobacterium nodulans]ACL63226.1 putative transcriptional regulator, Crp/Fnr family [Methylobacterium nodulans ORS 2060]